MRILTGLFFIIAGIVAGVYVGGWVMFVGGIVDIINAVKAPDVPALPIAIGALKVVCASLVGWVCGILPVAFGIAVLKD